MLKGIFMNWFGVWRVDWIDMPQDREMWRALVSAVMKFQMP
jgi:hypothetical protein